MSQWAIETINLTKRYGRSLAVDQLSLRVPAGSIYGFIGHNGAGKTTTLRMLAGLLEPTSGQIQLLGQPMKGQPPVGYMPDFFGVYDDLRVWEYLDFFARCHGIPAERRQSTIDGLLDLVDLAHKRTAFVQGLSRGMQQRLCLAHALVHDPPILLLDEPASGLDPQSRLELRELLRTLCEMGKTVVLSSHILNELEDICTDIGIMAHGKLQASGPLRELQRAEAHRLRIVLREGHEQARELLATTASVSGLLEPDPSDPGAIELDFAGGDDDAAALLGQLVAAGLPVVDFHRESNSLERLFLRLINQGPEAAAAPQEVPDVAHGS